MVRGTPFLEPEAQDAFERQVVQWIIDNVAASKETLGLLRRTGGYSEDALAQLLDVPQEAVRGWEDGSAPFSRCHWLVVAMLAEEALQGKRELEARLQRPSPPAGEIWLELGLAAGLYDDEE